MVKKIPQKFLPNEKGQGLVEYALIIVLVAIVVIAVLLTFGPAISQVYCRVANALQPGSCISGNGVIVSATTSLQGGARRVIVTVSELTNVTVNVTAGGNPASLISSPCSSVTTCTYNIPSWSSPGSATVTATAGGTATVTW
jgi:pilus assembly protein Flp/PilA